MTTLTRKLLNGIYNVDKFPENVLKIYVDKSHLTDIDPNALQEFTNLQILSLRVNQISIIDYITFQTLTRLQELWLSENKLTLLDPAVIGHLIKLKKLWCDNNLIKRIIPDNFSKLFNLKVLYLSGNRISEINSNTFRGLINLEELHLNDNQIKLIEPGGFDGLSSLNELALNGNRLTSLDSRIFNDLEMLKEIYLYNNQIHFFDAKCFAKNERLSVIEIFLESKNEIQEIKKLQKSNNRSYLMHPAFIQPIYDMGKSKKFCLDDNIYKIKEVQPDEYMYEKNKEYGRNYSKGQFKTLKLLGSGTFGKVFLVHDFIDNKKKCLKIMFNSCLTEEDSETIRTETLFLKDYKHSYIVDYTDCFNEKDLFCYVIEYCDMGDLKQLIGYYQKNKQKINEYTVFKWNRQIISGLCFLHENKIIHRDIKPSNIFLNGPDVKIGDLGLARNVGTHDNNIYSFVGTFNYLSPEQINNLGYLFKSDVWATGCVLYEMLTLKKAFAGGVFEICKAISECAVPQFKASPILEFLVKVMLQRSVSHRWDSGRILKFVEEVEYLICERDEARRTKSPSLSI